MKAIIVAMGKNREIGANQDLPWQRALPADLAHFKKLSTGKSVIMGRKTFESIGSKPLPNRQNIVVTSKPTGVQGVLSASSLEAAYAIAQYDIIVMGGVAIYEAALGDVEKLFVTEVDAEFPTATVVFPELDASKWKEVSREHHQSDDKNAYPYDFVTYERFDTSA